MRTPFILAAALAAGLSTGGTAEAATVVERACLQSGRAAGNRALCNCIQLVANITLSRRDQRLAAKIFKDPQLSQEMRQSNRRQDEAFWLKYKAFGASAETYCR